MGVKHFRIKTVASGVGFSMFLHGTVQGAWELCVTTPMMIVGLACADLADGCLLELAPDYYYFFFFFFFNNFLFLSYSYHTILY